MEEQESLRETDGVKEHQREAEGVGKKRERERGITKEQLLTVSIPLSQPLHCVCPAFLIFSPLLSLLFLLELDEFSTSTLKGQCGSG